MSAADFPLELRSQELVFRVEPAELIQASASGPDPLISAVVVAGDLEDAVVGPKKEKPETVWRR